MKDTCFIQSYQEVTLFDSVEEVWFWCCKGQLMRESGCQFMRKTSSVLRPCHIDDIFKMLIKLRFSGKISKQHIDILEKYGNRFCSPDENILEEKSDCLFWEEGLSYLEQACFRKKLIEKRGYHD